MEDKKIFYVVNCSDESFQNEFKKDKEVELISHIQIRNKLDNNDIYKKSCNEDLVKFSIIKKINNFTNSKKSKEVYYFLEEMDFEKVNALKKLVHKKIEFNLIVAESNYCELTPKIKSKFKNINLIEDDKSRFN